MISLIVWAVWSLIIGTVIYKARNLAIKENPSEEDVKAIKLGSAVLINFAITLPLIIILAML
ncbi:hypothetical protein NJ01_079 [Escherichia phage NJ01]|uniref:Uncharacterized protein n=3 Tax=Kuravirus TaxID=680277 RepID=K4I3V9_9CAUD|nr:hypothetical protein NJ01_079 [Escherichia phage NJ01]YP_009208231.1 hypothetical protein AVV18_gp083 [Escherichia phage 172-1]AFU62560.1 hypothetical protein NJ01_079 [Escherichia phage NJ01]AJW61448.1 hypothetical protein 1721_84 [Escherichia phage 172-1]WNL49137.1 hypothetical protein [Escherichia phage SDYTW1-F1-2-2_3]